MAGFFTGVCSVPYPDALGAACDRSTNLNVPILQRRVSARLGCGEEVKRDGREIWCRRGDSNPHEFPHHPLKMACLPIPPLRHLKKLLSINSRNPDYISCRNFSRKSTTWQAAWILPVCQTVARPWPVRSPGQPAASLLLLLPLPVPSGSVPA
jgi:hypothetical protein